MNKGIKFLFCYAVILSILFPFSQVYSFLPVSTQLEACANNEADVLDATQRNSVNMLNYLSMVLQDVSASKNSRLYLENVYSELLNNVEPSIIDERTLQEYNSLLETIHNYCLTDVQRERVNYLYAQRGASSILAVLPDPLEVLDTVASGNILHSLASLVYMAVAASSTYIDEENAVNNELTYLQEMWTLDDADAQNLHESRVNMFNYKVQVARELPVGYTLSENEINEFVSWKNNTNCTAKIRWLESNQIVYRNFGEYWIELADSYYEAGEYSKCLEAISCYEQLGISIFRRDYRLAQTLPFAIVSAEKTMTGQERIDAEIRFSERILNNTGNQDWALRFFVAQTYLSLYGKTADKTFLQKSFDLVLDNVNVLVSEQYNLNDAYLNEIIELTANNSASRQEKKSVKEYNKLLKKQRKTELPPIYEPLLLNCEVLFALADELDISEQQREEIDRILHPEMKEWLFLDLVLDKSFTFSEDVQFPTPNDFRVTYSAYSATHFLRLPALLVMNATRISVDIEAEGRHYVIEEWDVDEVVRNNSNNIGDFVVKFNTQIEEKIDISEGDIAVVSIFAPGPGSMDDTITYTLQAHKDTTLGIKSMEFEQIPA